MTGPRLPPPRALADWHARVAIALGTIAAAPLEAMAAEVTAEILAVTADPHAHYATVAAQIAERNTLRILQIAVENSHGRTPAPTRPEQS